MSTKSWGAALMVAGALFALSGCETPGTGEMDNLRSQIADLEARVSAAEASANEAATTANQCSQVCERTDRMFQQSLRK